MQERLRWWPSAVLALVLAGCGPDNGLDMARVRGRITHKGEPVRFGDVLFFVDEAKGSQGPSAVGKISQDGTYVLSTESPGDGAIVGFHKAAITGLDPKPIAAPVESEPRPISNTEAKKGLAAFSKAGRPKEAVATRGSGTYRIVTPEKLSRPSTSEINVEVKRGSNAINFAIQDDGSVKVE